MRIARTAAAVAALAVAPALASAQTWTTWNGFVPNVTATGDLFGWAVTYTGGFIAGQLSSGPGTDYFAPGDAYTKGGQTSPNTGGNIGFVQIDGPAVGTLHFGTPMNNLYFALISVGRTFEPVTYTFNRAFTVVSNNNCPTNTFWGCGSYTTSGNSITGNEFSGMLRFDGQISDLAISTTPGEFWHGFTVGADAAVTAAPEPATLLLTGTGLASLVVWRRRRTKAAANAEAV